MNLAEFDIVSQRYLRRTHIGIDSIDKCLNKKHFEQYPYPIDYEFNSRGFRDREWPADLVNCIWCIGDSFTLGIGCPYQHTWPYILEQHTKVRCINISIDGASNNWISRKAATVAKLVSPVAIVVQWSYLHRRELDLYSACCRAFDKFYNEIKDPAWPPATFATVSQLPQKIQRELSIHQQPLIDDFARQLHHDRSTNEQDIEHTADLWNWVDQTVDHHRTKIIYSAIPNIVPASHRQQFLRSVYFPFVQVKQLDQARDGQHYDINSATAFVQEISKLL